MLRGRVNSVNILFDGECFALTVDIGVRSRRSIFTATLAVWMPRESAAQRRLSLFNLLPGECAQVKQP